MAIDKKGLTRIGSSFNDAPSFWMYGGSDTIAVMLGTGYFNTAADVLAIGDTILLNDVTTPAKSFCYVSAIADGVVTIVDGVNI